jgi:hypothetical protein
MVNLHFWPGDGGDLRVAELVHLPMKNEGNIESARLETNAANNTPEPVREKSLLDVAAMARRF